MKGVATMKKKLFNYIYVFIIVGIIIGITVWIVSKKDSSYISQPTNDIQNNNESEVINKDEEEDYDKILKELRDAESNGEYHKGEYPNRADSRELNTEFITDTCCIIDPLAGYELEFIEYEELNNISEYVSKTGIIGDVYDLYIYDQILNKDGTLNNSTFKYKERLNDGKYGEEYVIDNYEMIAVRLKFKLKNTKNRLNEIDTLNIFTTDSFIYMDDNKFYRNSSINYYYNLATTTYTYPVYHSFMNRVKKGTFPSIISLSPLEELEGEIVYILGKQDLENIYLATSANNANIENFNGVYITFLPFKNLMNLSHK